ncbi:MAG: ribonuclease D [Gammaproteobacteria bacterium]|nr:ribonuclease D [Gammaproteobacteria bacterium]MBT4492953.1 ribonuclease D [Gammaproteobacteria bacterium]
MSKSSVNYIYVDSTDQLEAMAQACRVVDVLAVDTEFARFNTYYPIVGLVQIYTGKACYLIDPLDIEDLGPLAELLVDQSILKVFHACSEDMEVFQHALGIVPSPVFDTQISGAVLGVGFSMGYQAMVEHYLDISLPKDQTRSDWLARPLSSDQLDYAALDVIHLLQVYEKQFLALEESSKQAWVEAESLALGRDIPTMIDPELYYIKIKGLWQLDRKQLNLLRTLCAWREQTARTENKPRNRIVDQKALVTIVRQGIDDRQGFQQEAKMTPRQVRKYADNILFLMDEANLVPENECPPKVKREDTPVSSTKLNHLRQIVEQRAEALTVAPELLTKRRHLEKLIRSGNGSAGYQLPEELLGWREQAIGQALLEALAE